ncbi:MAG: hypothetical protein JJT82_10375 [Legionellaceae bacterium]|nr:hypothetical protein [Legionellaceae bacterium]
MRPYSGLWQTRLGHCIYQSPQGHQVWQNPWYRWLSFSSAPVQSIIYRHRPEKPVTACVRALTYAYQKEAGDLLLLGLGGGCVAHALSPFRAGKAWTFVEYDPEVITIAEQYFLLRHLQPFTLEKADACEFIHHSEKQYQHILIDLANAHQFPPQCATVSFWQACCQRLQDRGLLTLNLHHPPQQRLLFSQIQSVFPSTLIFHLPKMMNFVVIASKDRLASELLTRLEVSQNCRQVYWDKDWGIIAKC